MNIHELNAAMVAFGGAVTVLFGQTIMVNRHTIVIAENGSVMVDYNPVGKTSDRPFDLLDKIGNAIS